LLIIISLLKSLFIYFLDVLWASSDGHNLNK